MSRAKQGKIHNVWHIIKKITRQAKKQENITYNEYKYQSILNQLQTDTDIKIYRERYWKWL